MIKVTLFIAISESLIRVHDIDQVIERYLFVVLEKFNTWPVITTLMTPQRV